MDTADDKHTITTELKHRGMDVDQIASRLYIGAHILPVLYGHHLRLLGFGLHVLCAKELQPASYGTNVLRVLMDDVDRTTAYDEFLKAQRAAVEIAAFLKADTGRVLITCHQGINRSGLVMALVLRQQGLSPQEAIEAVQKGRPGALRNRAFVELVEGAS